MASSFADQLRVQLDGIRAELDRLDAKRRLIEELLKLESGSAALPVAPAASAPARRATRQAPSARRSRLPRGLITSKIREFLGGEREPVHATAILAYLEQHEAAPRSAKPMKTLQSSLQRLKEQGEIENAGRNHWRLRPAETAPPAAAASAPASTATGAATPAPGPSVVTSTTTFGTRSSSSQ